MGWLVVACVASVGCAATDDRGISVSNGRSDAGRRDASTDAVADDDAGEAPEPDGSGGGGGGGEGTGGWGGGTGGAGAGGAPDDAGGVPDSFVPSCAGTDESCGLPGACIDCSEWGNGSPLACNPKTQACVAPFGVASAASTSSTSIAVTFSAPPAPVQATTLTNYAIVGLTTSGTPWLSGNTVTITTSGQAARSYTITVTGVTREADAQPLSLASTSFTGTAVPTPTVTNVTVTSTSPDNGSVPFNTGTATVRITGTSLSTVSCPTGVRLDDLDGVGSPVGTQSTSCAVVSDTELTATFPTGIRTNGAAGWNVIVTNATGSNTTSGARFVPRAGLVISEVYTGSPAAREFLELYNPTSTSIDTAGLGLALHIRSSTGSHNSKPLKAVTSGVVPASGFLLLASSGSTDSDAWYAVRDYTYADALVVNGGAYVSLSATKDAKVIDKVGWGTQPSPGFEGTAAANVEAGKSIERKPAGGLGHAIDTDDNAADFNAPSSAITPRGTASPPEP